MKVIIKFAIKNWNFKVVLMWKHTDKVQHVHIFLLLPHLLFYIHSFLSFLTINKHKSTCVIFTESCCEWWCSLCVYELNKYFWENAKQQISLSSYPQFLQFFIMLMWDIIYSLWFNGEWKEFILSRGNKYTFRHRRRLTI